MTLDLSYCHRLVDPGLDPLGGSSTLTGLSLHSCWRLTPAGLSRLRGMPLTRPGCRDLSDESLEALRGMPLTDLVLDSSDWLIDAGLGRLKDLPLRNVRLNNCNKLTNDGLEILMGMPLSDLGLEGFRHLNDVSLGMLWRLPLTRLNLSNTDVRDSAMETFLGMPLTSLAVQWCGRFSPECKKLLLLNGIRA